MISDVNQCQGLVVNPTYVLAPGKRPILPYEVENKNRTTRPNQKTGIDTNTSAIPIAVRSSSEPRLIAEMIPIGMPASSQTIAAPIVSDSVAGSRSLIRLRTDAEL